ncbi:uncharacterized protein LW93_5972 [Fusarium fujikuroi]|nr:uncharacterized protein LW93_5972 [Fusarium fujikuroi]
MTDHDREASSSPRTLPEAPFFADGPYVDRLPASVVKFYLKKATVSAPALVTVTLSIADFHRYEDDIAAYVHRRFDYDPATQEITFRMTTPMHGMFAKYVENTILKELSKLDEGHSNFKAGIETVGTARIKLTLNSNAVSASGNDTERKGQFTLYHLYPNTRRLLLELRMKVLKWRRSKRGMRHVNPEIPNVESDNLQHICVRHIYQDQGAGRGAIAIDQLVH